MPELPTGFVPHNAAPPNLAVGVGAIVNLRSGEQRIIGPRPDAEPNWNVPWVKTGGSDDIVGYRPLDTQVLDQLVHNIEVILAYEPFDGPRERALKTQARAELMRLLDLYHEQWPYERSHPDVPRDADTFEHIQD